MTARKKPPSLVIRKIQPRNVTVREENLETWTHLSQNSVCIQESGDRGKGGLENETEPNASTGQIESLVVLILWSNTLCPFLSRFPMFRGTFALFCSRLSSERSRSGMGRMAHNTHARTCDPLSNNETSCPVSCPGVILVGRAKRQPWAQKGSKPY